MSLILPFIFGFLAAFVGVIPPGLINLTAAKISLIDGKKRAMMFVFGALIVVFFQTYISVIFAQYIQKHNEIIVLFREIGLAIFIALSLYFLFFAKKPKLKENKNVKIKSKKSRFFMGMIISAINFFPIPYYVLISVSLASYNVFTFEPIPIYSLVCGVVVGSFTVFYFYIKFFNSLKNKAHFFVNNINKVLGTITGLVALLTLFNIVKQYF